jgi:hypothetical protein
VKDQHKAIKRKNLPDFVGDGVGYTVKILKAFLGK